MRLTQLRNRFMDLALVDAKVADVFGQAHPPAHRCVVGEKDQRTARIGLK
jgi:hypothetical protein